MKATLTTFDEQIPLLIQNLEVCLRSGYNVLQTFEIIAQDLQAPMGVEAQHVVDAIKAGTPFLAAFDQWLERTPSRDLDLVLAAMRVQLEVGGNLADNMTLLGQIMGKRKIAAST